MMRQEHSAFFIIFFLFIIVIVHSQFIPPTNIDGFVYKHGRINSDTIVIDAFLDPVCPYSRDSWPALKHAVEYYSPHVGLMATEMIACGNCSYHDNAFVASRALHIVNELNPSATFDLLEGFFEHQYGASRGVYGAPSFFLNGFYLPDAGSTTNFTGWRGFIDPLIGEKGQQE